MVYNFKPNSIIDLSSRLAGVVIAKAIKLEEELLVKTDLVNKMKNLANQAVYGWIFTSEKTGQFLTTQAQFLKGKVDRPEPFFKGKLTLPKFQTSTNVSSIPQPQKPDIPKPDLNADPFKTPDLKKPEPPKPEPAPTPAAQAPVMKKPEPPKPEPAQAPAAQAPVMKKPEPPKPQPTQAPAAQAPAMKKPEPPKPQPTQAPAAQAPAMKKPKPPKPEPTPAVQDDLLGVPPSTGSAPKMDLSSVKTEAANADKAQPTAAPGQDNSGKKYSKSKLRDKTKEELINILVDQGVTNIKPSVNKAELIEKILKQQKQEKKKNK